MPATGPGTILAPARPVVPTVGTRRGLALTEMVLTEGFWAVRQQVNRSATFRHCLDWIERAGWLDNFDRVAAGTTGPDRPGWQFSDSEVYKLMEALAWEHGRTGDGEVEAQLLALVDRIGAAQDEDGYLNTCFGHPGRPERWSDLEQGHELYCAGHLMQAAVARARTHGPDRLVEIARRVADNVCETFGPDGRAAVCGHPEIELGLAELGRALSEPRYVEQARLFVDRRGHGVLGPIPLLGPAYFQDDVPVREAEVWRGHAVRALYLAAGAVDVAVDGGDEELLAAVQRQWARTVERRTYLTGGMGAHHQDEGFGEDWELPPDRAYCETCASVASIMVSWRLLLATDEVRYADLIERTLYNMVATSPRADGRAFFYANPLQQRVAGGDVLPDAVNPRAEGGLRAPWFEVSCCPTNVARTLASWQAYSATVDGDVVTLWQHASADLRVALDDGGALGLRVRTGYPEHGRIVIEVVEGPGRPVRLRLRVPSWARGARLQDPDGSVRDVAPGVAVVAGDVRPGDRIVLSLPVEPRLTWPDERIDAVRGCVAVERGPVVLCLESVDLPPGLGTDAVRFDESVQLRAEGDGARVGLVALPVPAEVDGELPFRASSAPAPVGQAVSATLVPYHRWAERGAGTMRVFIPVVGTTGRAGTSPADERVSGADIRDRR
ncbi:MAG: glycoside hydrolase family 127 protein [Actinobacteria bacterium]|nr:glycoside hydrolase family 127 protein [Actinomycetota bacterium]